MQKTSNAVLAFARLGVTVLLIGFLIWVMNQALTNPTPGSSPGQTFPAPAPTETSGLVVPPATPTYRATPTEAVSEQRTEVITYTVQPGDTIFGIAEKFELTPETILWGNYEAFSDDPHSLFVGMELNILPVDGVYYEWGIGDDLNEVASRFGVKPKDILNWPGNRLDPDTLGDWSNPDIDPGTMLVIPGGRREFVDWSAPRLDATP